MPKTLRLMLVVTVLLPPACSFAEKPHADVVKRLRQLHAAFEAYRADHDGHYPPSAEPQKDGRTVLWPELLKPYLNDKSKPGLVDPNGPFFAPYRSTRDRRGGRLSSVSFGYNWFGLGAHWPKDLARRRPVRVVPHPERTLLLVECEAAGQPGQGWYVAYPNAGIDFSRYKGRAHVLFCDGHVELLSPAELNVGERAATNHPPWFGDLSLAPSPQKQPRTKQPDRAGASRGSMPYLACPRVATPPVVDGRVAGDEWVACAAFCGFRSYTTKKLDPLDVTVFCGYDADRLYLCYIVPLEPGKEPNARITQHDGRVYKEDEIEAILLPAGQDDIRQICVNAIGTVFDRLGADRSWGGRWEIKAGRGQSADAPSGRSHVGSFWCVEMALPFADLGVSLPQPGEHWLINCCVGGQRQRVMAPTFQSFLDQKLFATLAFLPPRSPSLHLASLGQPCYGQLRLTGAAHNPGDQAAKFRFHALAQMKGTEVVEKTGFDEIVGAQAQLDETVLVPPGQSVTLDVRKTLADPRLNEIKVSVSAALASGETLRLYENQADLSILPPLRLVVKNYPTDSFVAGTIDTTGLGGSLAGVEAHCRVTNKAGQALMPTRSQLSSRVETKRIDCRTLAPGMYRWDVQLMRDGKPIADGEVPFERVGKPRWLGNDIGRRRVVLPPFTPMEYAEQKVRVWGRQMAWRAASMFPSQITSTGHPLLAAPIRLTAKCDGKPLVVPLGRMAFSEKAPDRCTMEIAGRAGNLRAEGAAWIEYDGLLWIDLSLRRTDEADLKIDALSIEIPLSKKHASYYHGVPDREITGAVKTSKLEFPFQPYFWVGSCERGLGVCFESMRNLSPPSSRGFHRIVPQADAVLWRISLIETPVRTSRLEYSLGIQATPVRPLPPDWHSWLMAHCSSRSDGMYKDFGPHVDFATVWPTFSGPRERWMRCAFCEPMHDRADRIAPPVEWLHERKTPAILYHAPMNFTDDACQAHTTYQHEWLRGPRTRWKAYDFVQTRACAGSSYQDYLLYAFRKTVREAKLDGLYFDGAGIGPCSNRRHGCGWVDDQGKVQPTWSIRSGRELNKRVAVMLHEEVEPRGIDSLPSQARPGWPRYYNWVHISGAVLPPALSFNTAYFSGEWFKGRIKRGVPYEDLLTLDTFRPRYLSTPWGVPNVFLPITREGSRKWRGGSQQSECILAYLLPHGVPLFARYLRADVRRTVITAMTTFGTRTATFHPAWKPCPAIDLDAGNSPNVLLAAWEKGERLLVVVSNVGKTEATARLAFRGRERMNIADVFPPPPDPGRATLRTSDGSCVVEIGPLTFRMLQVEL